MIPRLLSWQDDVSMLAIHQIGALGEATDAMDLHRRLRTIAWCLGFEHFAFGLQIDGVDEDDPVHFVLSGYPEWWQLKYQQKGYVRVDPTVAHCQHSTSVLVWSELLVTPESRPMWDAAYLAGLRHGVSVGTHEHHGVKSMLSLARAERPIDPAFAEDLARIVRVLANSAHFAATRLAVPQMVRQSLRLLSPRERDVFVETAHGKTTREIGEALHIGERTVGFHMSNIFRKLNCRNRQELIAKASHLGMEEALPLGQHRNGQISQENQ